MQERDLEYLLVTESAERRPLSQNVCQSVNRKSRAMTNLEGLEVEAGVDKVKHAPSLPRFRWGSRHRRVALPRIATLTLQQPHTQHGATAKHSDIFQFAISISSSASAELQLYHTRSGSSILPRTPFGSSFRHSAEACPSKLQHAWTNNTQEGPMSVRSCFVAQSHG